MVAHVTSTFWTEDRVTQLRALWHAGKSGTEIARAIGDGVTRRAVIGKAWRLQLPSRATPIKPSTGLPRAPKAPSVTRKPYDGNGVNARGGVVAKPPPQFKPGEVFLRPANDSAVPLLKRAAMQCSWPVGRPDHPSEQLCCGQPVREGANRAVPTYCADHAAIALSPQQPKSAGTKGLERTLRRYL